MNLFGKQPPYSQSQISEQIGIIAELQKQRDKAEASRKNEEYQRSNNAVMVAQEVLQHMLVRVQKFQERQ